MEAAGKEVVKAQKSGDSAAQSEAMAKLMAAALDSALHLRLADCGPQPCLGGRLSAGFTPLVAGKRANPMAPAVLFLPLLPRHLEGF